MPTDVPAGNVTKRPRHSILELPSSFATQTISLTMSGFTLVAALAWNEVIRSVINDYIRPYLGTGSGLITLLLYAIVTTLIAVAVGMQLARVQEKLQERERKAIELE